ncbi:MAG: cytochrome P460 family protein [Cellvibrionaceae bacterium]
MKDKIILFFTITMTLAGCTGADYAKTTVQSPPPKDGEIKIPKNYAQWPIFIGDIDKKKGKQVRDIYINTIGTQTKKGEAFPNGTQFVMTLYKAQKNTDGNLSQKDGKLIKGELSKIFVMEKGKNWGSNAPKGFENGDWVYAAYNADGSKAEVNYQACRGCHIPKAKQDYIFHYEQYFAK